jgi:type I restriction enzyme S subunit
LSVLNQISDLCKGSTRDFLNQRILKSIEFLLPPVPEQRQIVAEVERRLSVAAQVETVLAASVARASRLRQPALKAAFEGKMV